MITVFYFIIINYYKLQNKKFNTRFNDVILSTLCHYRFLQLNNI